MPYLQRHIEAAKDLDEELEREGPEVFHCPADVPGVDLREEPNLGKSYFDTENSSYAFNVHLYFLMDRQSLIGDRFDAPVKLSEVVRLLEGNITPVDCVIDPEICNRSGQCITRDLWGEIKKAIDDTLKSVTLQDMLEREREKGHSSEVSQ